MQLVLDKKQSSQLVYYFF